MSSTRMMTMFGRDCDESGSAIVSEDESSHSDKKTMVSTTILI